MTQIVIFQFFHVLNARSWHRSIFRIPLRDNPFLTVTLPLALLAYVAVLYLPIMQGVFETAPLALEHWAMAVGVGGIVIVAVEIDKAFFRGRKPRRSVDGEETDDDRDVDGEPDHRRNHTGLAGGVREEVAP